MYARVWREDSVEVCIRIDGNIYSDGWMEDAVSEALGSSISNLKVFRNFV